MARLQGREFGLDAKRGSIRLLVTIQHYTLGRAECEFHFLLDLCFPVSGGAFEMFLTLGAILIIVPEMFFHCQSLSSCSAWPCLNRRTSFTVGKILEANTLLRATFLQRKQIRHS